MITVWIYSVSFTLASKSPMLVNHAKFNFLFFFLLGTVLSREEYICLWQEKDSTSHMSFSYVSVKEREIWEHKVLGIVRCIVISTHQWFWWPEAQACSVISLTIYFFLVFSCYLLLCYLWHKEMWLFELKANDSKDQGSAMTRKEFSES